MPCLVYRHNTGCADDIICSGGSNEVEELLIEREKTIIKDRVRIREEQGLSQAQLGRLCKVKQPVIARMEKSVHSPQLSSILKILEPMGYTLQIVPAQTEKN